jgi:tagatose-1,6-bisphosphate aldolase
LFDEDAGISGGKDLFGEVLRDEAVARLNELGKVIESRSHNFSFSHLLF